MLQKVIDGIQWYKAKNSSTEIKNVLFVFDARNNWRKQPFSFDLDTELASQKEEGHELWWYGHLIKIKDEDRHMAKKWLERSGGQVEV